jgi:hypothetical protein
VFKVIAVKVAWNKGTGLDITDGNRAATLRMLVAPAQKMVVLPWVGTHLSSRNVEQMTWVVGGVSDASGEPTSFLDKRHLDRSRRQARKVNGGERSGKACPYYGNITVSVRRRRV